MWRKVPSFAHYPTSLAAFRVVATVRDWTKRGKPLPVATIGSSFTNATSESPIRARWRRSSTGPRPGRSDGGGPAPSSARCARSRAASARTRFGTTRPPPAWPSHPAAGGRTDARVPARPRQSPGPPSSSAPNRRTASFPSHNPLTSSRKIAVSRSLKSSFCDLG